MGDFTNLNNTHDNETSIYNTPDTTLVLDSSATEDRSNDNINRTFIESEQGVTDNVPQFPRRSNVSKLDNNDSFSTEDPLVGFAPSANTSVETTSKRKREDSLNSHSLIVDDDPASDITDIGSDMDTSSIDKMSSKSSPVKTEPQSAGNASEGSALKESIEETVDLSQDGLWFDGYTGQHFPHTISVLTTPKGARVYLVGTVHFSAQSLEDVSKAIQAVQPHIVLIELCQSRISYLYNDEESMLQDVTDLTFQKMMQILSRGGLASGLVFLCLLKLQANLAQQIGSPPGLEFRRAVLEAKKVPGCIIHLGDRPLMITLRRLIAAISWWELTRMLFSMLVDKSDFTKEEIENLKNNGLVENLLAELAEQCPTVRHVFVDERDSYIAHSLQIAAMQHQVDENGAPVPCRVVGVVGKGHMKGIAAKWGKVSSEDIKPLSVVPPPSLGTKIIRISMRASFWGLVIYGVTRFGVVRRNLPSLNGVLATASSATNLFSRK